jgi:hypothetical protein
VTGGESSLVRTRLQPTNSLLTGKLTGNFVDSGPLPHFGAQFDSEFNGLQPNSLRNGTGNYLKLIREYSRLKRPHLVTNAGDTSAVFLVLQGIGEYDCVPLT